MGAKPKRSMMVTSALPYANGPLHLGHLVEHIQTDIWVRTNRMLGHECMSLCGDDAHGTPIMLKAEQLGLTPEALTSQIKASHEQDFKAFDIHYDCYHSTHSEENKHQTHTIFERLLKQGDIFKQEIKQAYDTVKHIFLPDRYVKGECPRCQAVDQYGDNCEACGATYRPTDLHHPVSVLSGTPPIEKITEHYFFNLPHYAAFLKTWTHAGHLQLEMANKLSEWFEQGLLPWDITRDAPYFGFLIPGTHDQYFYVWLDAPVGYMASCQQYCNQKGLDFESFWQPDTPIELYHFIGKDILYFHALFWPAVLQAAGYRTPTAIFAHGFLTVNGKKMSKSRGTFIEANTFLKHLPPETLRYYFAAKLNGRVEDVDLNLDDLLNRVNADLVGKIINIASRSCGFIHQYFNGMLADHLHTPTLYEQVVAAKPYIIDAYLARDYAKAIRKIIECADLVNQYIDQHKPWALCKDESTRPSVWPICTQSLNLFRVLMAYLKPVVPTLAQATEALFNTSPLTFEALSTPVLSQSIQPFTPMLQRIKPEQIQALLNESAS